jgi:hypothetical protein
MKKAFLILTLAVFASVLLAQTKTELKSTELQKPITQYIEQNFTGYSIIKIFKVDEKGVITFDICISKDKDHEKLFFDKDGKFLRKESCTNECCQGPVKK